MNKRNHFLDFWKFIAAIGVILVHIPFPGPIGKILEAAGNGGVCLFAVISGYACFGESKEASEKIIKRLKRVTAITAVTLIIYVIFSFFLMSSIGQSELWIRGFSDPRSYLRMIVLGDFEFFYAAFLWYMVALIYCYIIFYFLIRYNKTKIIYILLPVTILLRIAAGIYTGTTGASWHIRNNFLAGVLPMMCIGYAVAGHKAKIEKLSKEFLTTITLLSAVLMLTSFSFTINGLDLSQPFTILFITFLFITGIRMPESYIIKPIAYLGQKDSLYIYLFHVIVILVLRSIINSFPISADTIRIILPILSIIGSVLFARLLSVTVSRVKKTVRD
ncbi:MAG: acyltransferase [Clostridiales bacterium]|nr:acyltransferase [Clostridiales bacterium]